jgi:hypothetical protein
VPGRTAVALLVTATVFTPENWPVYVAGNLMVAATYALVGVLVGPLFGRVSGVFLAFLIPFLDVGISQSPMLGTQPDEWAHWLPAYGGTRVMLDGALTASFDETRPLLYSCVWLVGLAVATGLMWRRTSSVPGNRKTSHAVGSSPAAAPG